VSDQGAQAGLVQPTFVVDHEYVTMFGPIKGFEENFDAPAEAQW